MSEARSWYEVLGVDPDATDDDLRAAHRAASKRLHPDAGGSSGEFQLVQTAYEVLADPVTRAEHDRELRGEPPVAPGGAAATPVRPTHPGPGVRPASAPQAAPPPPSSGCLTPWVVVAAGVAIVVAVLVTIATLSSSSGPDASGPRATAAPGSPTAPPIAGTTGGAGTIGSTPRTGLPGAVTTVVATDLPPDFPRGHVPLPAGSHLDGVTLAGSDRGTPTVTIRASGSGTDAERAAINYASSLQAAGWSIAPDEDPDLATSDAVRRSLIDSDGSILQFVVTEADGGGLSYVVGFHQGRR